MYFIIAGKHSNCEDLANKQDGESGLWFALCDHILMRREQSFYFELLKLDASCPITEGFISQKHVDHSTVIEPHCKSKTLSSWQFPQGGAEQSYRAQILELSPSTQVTGKQTLVSILPFALNQPISYFKHCTF